MKKTDVQASFREPIWAWLQLILAVFNIVLWVWLGARIVQNGTLWWPLLIFNGFVLISALSAVRAIRRLRNQQKQH